MLAPAAAVFSLLLIVTGIAKIVRPADVEKALKRLGMPAFGGVGVAIGVVEVVVGAAALLIPQLLFIQAGMYALFAVWVFVALRSGSPIASCGCFGRDDTPPTVAHIALNVLAVVVSSLAVIGPPLDLEVGFGGVATAVAIVVGVFLSYVLLTDAAILVGVRKP